jgi:hypothetical protein
MKAPLAWLGTLALLLAAGCPRQADDDAPDVRGAEAAGRSARPGEEQRLSVKIAALTKLREELETVRGELSGDAKRAASLNVLYVTLRNRLGAERSDEIVAAVRASRAADRPPAAAAGGPMNRRERLTRLQTTGTSLMVPEVAGDGDSKVVALLKRRLAAEQQATGPVLAAAKLGADALAHVEELEQVVGELAKVAEAEGIPVKPLPKRALRDAGR